LTPSSHNITVYWKEPILNNYCVTKYVINWKHAVSQSSNHSIVSHEEDFFVIEDVDACVDYNVSVSAQNKKDESTGAVTENMATEAVGNYHTQINFYYVYDVGAHK
jgi:hypothetical protein